MHFRNVTSNTFPLFAHLQLHFHLHIYPLLANFAFEFSTVDVYYYYYTMMTVGFICRGFYCKAATDSWL